MTSFIAHDFMHEHIDQASANQPVRPAPQVPPVAPVAPPAPIEGADAANAVAPVSQQIASGGDPKWVINDKEITRIKWEGGAVQFTYTDGTTQQMPVREFIPDGAVDIFQSFAFMVIMLVVGRPIARAIARRIDRAVPPVPKKVFEQLDQMEQSLDHMALEVERVGEVQRYNARVLAGELVAHGETPQAYSRQREPVRAGSST